jgi:hypothetical protein
MYLSRNGGTTSVASFEALMALAREMQRAI